MSERITEAQKDEPASEKQLAFIGDVLLVAQFPCEECGARLTLYVVGVCPRCEFDLTGNDPEREARDARDGLRAAESPREGTEA
jgi:hypothetical protein